MKTITGALPPSSRCTRFTPSTAPRITALPVWVEPVTLTMSTSRCVTSACPTSASPVTTLNRPAGRPACTASSANRRVVRGVAGAGLTITALPAASAGPAFQIAMMSGKFHGVMPATTPTGRRVRIDV